MCFHVLRGTFSLEKIFEWDKVIFEYDAGFCTEISQIQWRFLVNSSLCIHTHSYKLHTPSHTDMLDLTYRIAHAEKKNIRSVSFALNDPIQRNAQTQVKWGCPTAGISTPPSANTDAAVLLKRGGKEDICALQSVWDDSRL